MRTVWTGREVVAFVADEQPVGRSSCRTVAFDPVTDTWRLVSDDIPLPSAVAWDGRHVRAVVGAHLLALDADGWIFDLTD